MTTPPRVTSRLTYRINIGNYESFEIVTGLEADVRDGEHPDEAEERVFNIVEAQLQRRYEQAVEQFIHKRRQAQQEG